MLFSRPPGKELFPFDFFAVMSKLTLEEGIFILTWEKANAENITAVKSVLFFFITLSYFNIMCLKNHKLKLDKSELFNLYGANILSLELN